MSEKIEEIWLSLETKAPVSIEKSKSKTTTQQRFQNVKGRSVRVTAATQLLWLNRLRGFQPCQYSQKLCHQKYAHFKKIQGKCVKSTRDSQSTVPAVTSVNNNIIWTEEKMVRVIFLSHSWASLPIACTFVSHISAFFSRKREECRIMWYERERKGKEYTGTREKCGMNNCSCLYVSYSPLHSWQWKQSIGKAYEDIVHVTFTNVETTNNNTDLLGQMRTN